MASGPLYRVAFRRRREGKTNYRKRLALLKGGGARVVVRTSNRNVIIQFINYDEAGDQVVASAESRELVEMGYKSAGNNTPSAYLAGRLAAVRAKEKGIDAGFLDLGLAHPHKGGVIFAALKGVVDGGVAVPAGEGVYPDEGRLRAEHLGEEKAAAFAASYQKIVGSALPPKAEKKPVKSKGAPAPAKGAAPAKDNKKAKTPK